MSTQQRIHHLGSGESLSAAAIPTPQSGSPCASQLVGRVKPALLVARGCMRCVRAPPAEGLTHSKAPRPLSSSSLLSEGEFETEVEELEGREDNDRERDLSGLFTGDGGVSSFSSSSLLSEVEFETEVEELEEREDNVRERDYSGLFTGDEGVSPLANRWRKSPTASPRLHRVKEPGFEVELARNLGVAA